MEPFLKPGAVALVTGGASGLGRAVVDRLISKGVVVYVVDRQEPLDDAAKKQKDLFQFRKGDVTSEKDITAVVEEIRSKHNRLDLVVNSAGIFLVKALYDFKADKPHNLDELARVYNVNVIGTLNVIRLAVGVMSKNKPNADGQRGVIVNLSSCSHRDCCGGIAAYGSSKAAIAALSVPLAREFGPVGIRVVAVSPGLFWTPMIQHHEGLVQGCPGVTAFPARLGQPEELAHLVEFICENTFVNATTLDLHGGLTNPISAV